MLILVGCKSPQEKGDDNLPPKTGTIIDANTDGKSSRQEPSDALAILSEGIMANPANDSLYFERAVLQLRAGNDQDGFYDLYKAIQINPKVAKYYTTGANFYIGGGDLRSAEELLKDGKAVMPNAYEFSFELAKIKLYVKDYEESISLFQRTLGLAPNRKEAWLYMGVTYFESGDQKRAVKSLKQAVDIDPDYGEALFLLGKYYREDYGLSLAYYNNALRLAPENADILYAIGTLHQDKKEFAKAKEIYRKIMFVDRQYEDAYYNLGYIYLQEDSLIKAGKHFDMCIGVSPTSGRAYYMRGLCAEKRGELDKARSDFNQALVFDENLKEAEEALKRVGK